MAREFSRYTIGNGTFSKSTIWRPPYDYTRVKTKSTQPFNMDFGYALTEPLFAARDHANKIAAEKRKVKEANMQGAYQDDDYHPTLVTDDDVIKTTDELRTRLNKAMSPTPHEEEGNTKPSPRVGKKRASPVCPPAPLKRSKNGLRGRFWCFTLNNPTVDDHEHIRRYCQSDDDIRYLTYGIEQGTLGTHHFQGYLELKNTWSLSKLRTRISDRAHWEPRHGTAEQANSYCWKQDDEPYIFGTMSKGSGQRTDLESVQADIDGGASLKTIATNHFGTFLRYNRGLAQYVSLTRSLKRREPPKIQWLWGESGAGKSVTMNEIVEELDLDDVFFLSTSPTGTWWGGYNGQKYVVMDDFRASWFPHNVILRLLDCVPMTVPYHGGATPLEATNWIITTNSPPHMVYKEDPAGALIRRVHDFATVYELRVGGYIECVQKPKCEKSNTLPLC